MGRTGSTLLADQLDSHPQIECGGEIFGAEYGIVEHTGMSRREFLETRAYKTDKPIRGFKMPLDWILKYPGIFDDFRDLNYRIIRLTRTDILGHYVSIQLATKNVNWGSKLPYTNQRVAVDPWGFIAFVYASGFQDMLLDRFSDGMPMAKIDYADLLNEERQATLLKFLGAAERKLTTTTVKQRTVPLRESIENYDAFQAVLATTPLGVYAPA